MDCEWILFNEQSNEAHAALDARGEELARRAAVSVREARMGQREAEADGPAAKARQAGRKILACASALEGLEAELPAAFKPLSRREDEVGGLTGLPGLAPRPVVCRTVGCRALDRKRRGPPPQEPLGCGALCCSPHSHCCLQIQTTPAQVVARVREALAADRAAARNAPHGAEEQQQEQREAAEVAREDNCSCEEGGVGAAGQVGGVRGGHRPQDWGPGTAREAAPPALSCLARRLCWAMQRSGVPP
jgi:hypothetical protein